MERNERIDLETEAGFISIQNDLIPRIRLENSFAREDINYVAGIDLAYWSESGVDYAVCCIVVVDYHTKQVVEMKTESDRVTVPYLAGYLSFRELPLIVKTYHLLETEPDLVMFDGNGYLHYRHMGIATHASFYIDKPTIGVAKSYLKIENTEFIMPEDEAQAYSDVVIHNEIYGRALRTHKGVKPIFVSCGNRIDLDTATEIVSYFIEDDSRQPIPTRMADIETRKQRSRFLNIVNE